jgi:hypothetical protein
MAGKALREIGAFLFRGWRKRDCNTELTEGRTQRAQRRKAGDWLKSRRDPSTPRPDAPNCGAEEKIGPLRSLLRRASGMTSGAVGGALMQRKRV